MNVVFVFAGIGAALFIASFLTKRRFGFLGLALAAGSLLSTIWTPFLTRLIDASGYDFFGTLTDTVVLSAIVVAPAVLLIFHGPSYKGGVGRLFGALFFAVLTLAFLVKPLGYSLPLTDVTGLNAYKWIEANSTWIIGVGLIFAVLDVFITKPAHHGDDKDKHKH